MTDPKATLSPSAAELTLPEADVRKQRRQFFVALAVLAGCFGYTLWELTRFAMGSSLYSHIPLVPVVSGYLLWIRRGQIPPITRGARLPATILATGAAVLLALYGLSIASGTEFELATSLAFRTAALVLLFAAATAWFLGGRIVRSAAFSLGFLVFMVPFPDSWAAAIETVSQYGSAAVARALFAVSGTSVFYQDLTFQLAGITFRVAPECSGIHSTLALFILSILAGHLFLRSVGRAAILSCFVFPLALLRNGFRIFTIGELCVHIGPEMIDSPIHHKGGPIFFALSLIPFLLLLWILIRSERRPVGVRSN